MHYRKKYLILFSALVFTVLRCIAQEDSLRQEIADTVQAQAAEFNDSPEYSETVLSGPMDYNSIEKISYRLYLDKQWLQLSQYCERAFKINIDYYYLRVRAGVAFFELKQYRKAIVHFKKALDFNTGDDFANSYLYYSYLYSERFEEAKLLTTTFSKSLVSSMKTEYISPVDFAFMESGIKAPDSSKQFKNAFFTDIGLNHSIANRFFLFHNLTYYTQNEARFSVKQLQYYIRGSVPLKNGFQVAAGFHLVNVNADVRSFVGSTYTHTYLVTPPLPPSGQQPPPFAATVTDSTYTEKITNRQNQSYVGAFTLTKRTVYADYSFGTTIAHFDTTQQFQLSFGINLYPFMNNRFSVGGSIYLHSEKSSANNIAIAPVLSAYLSKKIHLAASFLSNTGPNISENTGSFVSNSIDYTTQRISFTCSFNVANGFWLYGTYANEQKKHLSAGYNYDYNIFVIGFKIIPWSK